MTIDTPALERYLRDALPGEQVQVSASGQSVTLSGTVKDPVSMDRAVEIAKGTGVENVVNNLVAPPAVQLMLQVRFAEISRSNLKDFSAALSTLNPQDLKSDGDWTATSISDGLLRVLLSNPNANIQAIINASITKGTLRSLAEPNLLTLPGKEASFLAGGGFPYPTALGETVQYGMQCFSIGPAAMDPDHPECAEDAAHHRVFMKLDLCQWINWIGNAGTKQHGISVTEMVDDHQGRPLFGEVLHAFHGGFHCEQRDQPQQRLRRVTEDAPCRRETRQANQFGPPELGTGLGREDG